MNSCPPARLPAPQTLPAPVLRVPFLFFLSLSVRVFRFVQVIREVRINAHQLRVRTAVHGICLRLRHAGHPARLGGIAIFVHNLQTTHKETHKKHRGRTQRTHTRHTVQNPLSPPATPNARRAALRCAACPFLPVCSALPPPPPPPVTDRSSHAWVRPLFKIDDCQSMEFAEERSGRTRRRRQYAAEWPGGAQLPSCGRGRRCGQFLHACRHLQSPLYALRIGHLLSRPCGGHLQMLISIALLVLLKERTHLRGIETRLLSGEVQRSNVIVRNVLQQHTPHTGTERERTHP
jgi:hypothetical protein